MNRCRTVSTPPPAGYRRYRVQLGPSTHIIYTIDRRGCYLGDHCFWAGLVGQPQADAGVYLCAVAWVGVAQQSEETAEPFDDRADLVVGHPFGRGPLGADHRLGGCAECGGLLDPAGDEGWVSPGV